MLIHLVVADNIEVNSAGQKVLSASNWVSQKAYILEGEGRRASEGLVSSLEVNDSWFLCTTEHVDPNRIWFLA